MWDEVFGIPIQYKSWNKQGMLPLYISAAYEFKTAYINEIQCTMLSPKEELPNVQTLKKQIEKIRMTDPVPVVLQLRTVSFYRRKSLIENRIPFITERQLYLPFLGMLLMNERKMDRKAEKFTLSAQLLFLFYLYQKKERLYLAEAAETLPFSAMTLTRACRQIESTGLIDVSKEGVYKVIESNYGRKELFEEAKKYLKTPVCKAGYIEKSERTEYMLPAGETVLAERTMLNMPAIETYAVSGKQFDERKMADELIDPEKQIRLEIWGYDPGLFSNAQRADSISVALSFCGHADERIAEAAEELVEKELQRVW